MMKSRQEDRESMTGMAFRVVEVTKLLASVSRICSKGSMVVFDSEQSSILKKRTGRRRPLLHERGVYVIKVPVRNVIADKSD